MTSFHIWIDKHIKYETPWAVLSIVRTVFKASERCSARANRQTRNEMTKVKKYHKTKSDEYGLSKKEHGIDSIVNHQCALMYTRIFFSRCKRSRTGLTLTINLEQIEIPNLRTGKSKRPKSELYLCIIYITNIVIIVICLKATARHMHTELTANIQLSNCMMRWPSPQSHASNRLSAVIGIASTSIKTRWAFGSLHWHDARRSISTANHYIYIHIG